MITNDFAAKVLELATDAAAVDAKMQMHHRLATQAAEKDQGLFALREPTIGAVASIGRRMQELGHDLMDSNHDLACWINGMGRQYSSGARNLAEMGRRGIAPTDGGWVRMTNEGAALMSRATDVVFSARNVMAAGAVAALV